MLSSLEMSVGSHKHSLKSFENLNCLIFSGLNYAIYRQIFIFFLVCFHSNAWSLLWMLLLTKKQSAYCHPRCSNSHSFLEVCFQSHSLFWPSIITQFFTHYSVLKIRILRANYINTGEAREQRMLGEQYWRFLGRTEVPRRPPQGRLTECDEMRSLQQTQILTFLPLSNILIVMDSLPVPSHKLQTKRNLTAFPKTKFCCAFWGDQVEKQPLELSDLCPLPS